MMIERMVNMTSKYRNEDFASTFTYLLNLWKIKNKKTELEFAEEVGISRTSIHYYKKGEKFPNDGTLKILSKALSNDNFSEKLIFNAFNGQSQLQRESYLVKVKEACCEDLGINIDTLEYFKRMTDFNTFPIFENSEHYLINVEGLDSALLSLEMKYVKNSPFIYTKNNKNYLFSNEDIAKIQLLFLQPLEKKYKDCLKHYIELKQLEESIKEGDNNGNNPKKK